MNWRLIIDGPLGASRNMAVDEAISIFVRKKISPPTLRLYSWPSPAITIGYFQQIQREVNLERCKQNNIDVVRRITGGRAVIHGLEELTYSFSTPFLSPFSGSNLYETYKLLSNAFITGFRRLGIAAEILSVRSPSTLQQSTMSTGKNPACFQSLSFAEAVVDGRKIIGSAQKRWTSGLMQQGSIPLELNYNHIYSLLSFRSKETRKLAMDAAREKMAGLRDFVPKLSPDDLIAAIKYGFKTTFGVDFKKEELSLEEERTADILDVKRYVNKTWNLKR